MSNIQLLPQLSIDFTLANNSDWNDALTIPNQSGEGVIDLTGIDFVATMRTTDQSPLILLRCTTFTGDNTLINQGANGTLQFNVPAVIMAQLPGDTSAVMDIVAYDSLTGATINLCETAPAQIKITQGITLDMTQEIASYLESLVSLLPNSPPIVPPYIGFWINGGVICVSPLNLALPTAQPSSAGKLWNNNGVLNVTQPSSLPTYPPALHGMFWNKNGVVNVS